MNNVQVHLTLQRHNSNGSARIRGRVGEERVDVNIRRGVRDANAYVSGDWGQRDNVDLTVNRDASQGYNAIDGQLRDQTIHADLDRKVGGDTTVRADGEVLAIDRDRRGEQVALRGSEVTGSFSRALRDGDESGRLRKGDENVRFHIDRDVKSGDFIIAGRSSDGNLRLVGDRDLDRGSITFRGSLPEGTEAFPIFWEILGDDKNIPDRNPMYPGSILGMSWFLEE